MSVDAGHKRDESHTSDEVCPVCGSPVRGDATASGIGIHFCSRCTWYQVRSADGRVADEDAVGRSSSAA